MNEIPLAARFAAPLAVGALLAAGCSSNTTSSSSSGGGATGGATGSATVSTRSGPDGTYLTDGSGRTLYLFMADTGSSSNCAGSCASTWTPLTTTGAPASGSGAMMSDLGTITRSDGMKQVTYSGHPLYYYALDSSAGQMTGQGNTGFGARWWIVSPTGQPIMGMSGGSGTPAPSGGSSTKSGGGWA